MEEYSRDNVQLFISPIGSSGNLKSWVHGKELLIARIESMFLSDESCLQPGVRSCEGGPGYLAIWVSAGALLESVSHFLFSL